MTAENRRIPEAEQSDALARLPIELQAVALKSEHWGATGQPRRLATYAETGKSW